LQGMRQKANRLELQRLHVFVEGNMERRHKGVCVRCPIPAAGQAWAQETAPFLAVASVCWLSSFPLFTGWTPPQCVGPWHAPQSMLMRALAGQLHAEKTVTVRARVCTPVGVSARWHGQLLA
jgi:hypothetical protein